MDKGEVAGKTPVVLELEPGKYYWCSCGKSKNQPYCDGAHKGSGFAPKLVEITEKKKVALCMCKQSENGAFCDGSHNKI